MKLTSLLILAFLPLLLLGAAGCSGDDTAKPKVLKGGLDPEKGKSEKEFKTGPLS
jgi:hypothetical protein